MFNNWNLDRGIQKRAPDHLSWKAVTTGNYGGIDLELDGREGTLAFETKPASGKVDLASLGVDPVVFEAGGLERAVMLQRLPDRFTKTRLSIVRRVRVRAKGDTRLFARVQQEDGHRIWSSPVYLFRH